MSFKVIDVDTLSLVISSMSVPMCNRFHATEANSDKITTFWEGTPI